MSTIDPTDFLDGQTGIADLLFDQFYGSGGVLRTMNGLLDETNFTASPLVTYKNVQSNAFSGGGQVAGTASLDFFSGGAGTNTGSGFFRGASLSNEDRYLPIPGASIKFYLPYEALVLLNWTVTWTNDSDDQALTSNIVLFIDGDLAHGTDALTSAQARRVRRTQFGGSTAASGSTIESATGDSLQDRYKARTWSGHYFTPGASPLAPGWHEASIRLCASPTVKQTRVRARSMKYVYFKYGATI